MKRNTLTLVGAAVMALATVPAYAFDTLVQFSSDGTGSNTPPPGSGYDVTGINEFDWQSSGDLVIVDNLTGTGSTAGGTLYDSFAAWAANAVVGDTVTFDAHVQARLNDMLDTGGGSVAPTNLSTDGGVTTIGGGACGAGCFEITAAASFTETATLVAPGVLLFTSISGTGTWYYDSTPDSVVSGGTGFTDGTAILNGSLSCNGLTCGTFTQGTGGSNFTTLDVTSYDTNYLEVDPITGLTTLAGATFDTLISFVTSGEANVGVGGTIGLLPGYTVALADLIFKADANSEFQAEQVVVPEPTTVALVGLGLAGIAGLRRRRRS